MSLWSFLSQTISRSKGKHVLRGELWDTRATPELLWENISLSHKNQTITVLNSGVICAGGVSEWLANCRPHKVLWLDVWVCERRNWLFYFNINSRAIWRYHTDLIGVVWEIRSSLTVWGQTLSKMLSARSVAKNCCDNPWNLSLPEIVLGYTEIMHGGYMGKIDFLHSAARLLTVPLQEEKWFIFCTWA